MIYQARTAAERTPKALLEWVAKHINKENYDQGCFCGTVCCIGGWIDVRLNGMKEHLKHSPFTVVRIAKMALDEPVASHVVPWLLHSKPVSPFVHFPKKFTPALARKAIKLYIKERGW